MELSSILEADIQDIQKQLKTAILNHQIGMMKLRNDPENLEIKKQIADAQNTIISLSTSQKFILQKLRKDALANGLNKSTCDNGSNNKGVNPVITINGLNHSTHPGVMTNAHNNMGQHKQQLSVTKSRSPGISTSTEPLVLPCIARENQVSPKANGNLQRKAAAETSAVGGKIAQEGPPPYRNHPHPTPPSLLSSSHQNNHLHVENRLGQCISPGSPRVGLSRSSASPYSSGGEELLDGDEDDDEVVEEDDEDEEEEEEEDEEEDEDVVVVGRRRREYEYELEDEMEELKYIPEEDEDKEDVKPIIKETSSSICRFASQSHPSDDSDVDTKLKFFAALGLVTRETCSEMQSRRGERKRRSTANPQFVYGNWDISKRKKNGYLLSSSSPLQLRKRGRPRLDASSELLPSSYLPLPKSLSNISYTKDMLNANDHFNENQHQFGLSHGHQMLGHSLGGTLKTSQHYYASESSHSFHPKKPLEHINGNISTIRKFCIVCKNMSGPLVLCEDCDVRYHPFCGKPIDGKRHCPKCETRSSTSNSTNNNSNNNNVNHSVKEEISSPGMVNCREVVAVSTSVSSSSVSCIPQVTKTSGTTTLNSVAAERAAKVEEKRRLLIRNQELNAEKAKLEQRVSELSADLSTQAARKKELLSLEEKTRKSIKKVHDFIRNFQQGFRRTEDDGSSYKTSTPSSTQQRSISTETGEGGMQQSS